MVNSVLILDEVGNEGFYGHNRWSHLHYSKGMQAVLWQKDSEGGKGGTTDSEESCVSVQIRCDDGLAMGGSYWGGEKTMSPRHSLRDELTGLAAELDLGQKRRIRNVCLSVLFIVCLCVCV